MDAALELLDGHPVQLSGKLVGGRRVGVHVWGRIPWRRTRGNRYGSIPITLRHVGNQVVVAPSRRAGGEQYEWIRELPRDPMLLPHFDVRWLRHESPRRTVRRKQGESDAAHAARIRDDWWRRLFESEEVFTDGERHEALLMLRWFLRKQRRPRALIQARLEEFAATRCQRTGRFSPMASAHEARGLQREIDDLVRR
jgi:hypothetical protein